MFPQPVVSIDFVELFTNLSSFFNCTYTGGNRNFFTETGKASFAISGCYLFYLSLLNAFGSSILLSVVFLLL